MKATMFAAVLLIALAQDGHADPTKKLMGLSEDELISCAGIPLASMSAGKKTFYQFGDVSEAGGIVQMGDSAVFAKKQKGCVATITVEDGIVRKVMLKTRGLISGPLACNRIFAACE